jgi:RNA polymerase sigma factor (sigma-70 family)
MPVTPTNDASTGATSNIADLLPRIGDGDPKAWEEILRRYSTLVWATARSFRLQDADALDAVQTTWLRLAENTHRIRHPQRLGAWLATTARRECLQMLRHNTSISHFSQTHQEPATNSSTGPEHITIEADTTQWLWQHVDKLSLRRRTLLRALFTDDPPPYTEIATITGIPRGGIGPTRNRALQQLREDLDKNNPEDMRQ